MTKTVCENRALRGALLYSALIGWMVLIYLFSDEPHSAEITREIFHDWNYIARKLAHFSEYAFLAMLAIASFSSHIPDEQSLDAKEHKMAFFSAIAVAVLYAISDEIHQAFVPGRSALATDVLVDSSGVICGALLYAYLRRRRRKVLSEKTNQC